MDLKRLIDGFKEPFRPELKVRDDILAREMKFKQEDINRESWVLGYVCLCGGDLDTLKQHPNFDRKGQEIEFVHTNYVVPHIKGKQFTRSRRVRVNVPNILFSEGEAIGIVERKLKLDLHSRGCNAGVFYRTYQKGPQLYAEAVPAEISSEP